MQLEFIILLVFCYLLPLIHKLVYNFSRRFTTPFIYVLFSWLCDEVCQWFATGRWFSSGTLISSTNKTDCHNITEIMLKVALNTITLTLILNFIFLFLWKKILVVVKVESLAIQLFPVNVEHVADEQNVCIHVPYFLY